VREAGIDGCHQAWVASQIEYGHSSIAHVANDGDSTMAADIR